MSRIRMYVNRELTDGDEDSRWPEALELLTKHLGATSVSVAQAAGDDPMVWQSTPMDVVTFQVPGAPDGATRVDATFRTGREAGALEVHELLWWGDRAPLDPQPVDWKPARAGRIPVEITPTDDGKATRILLDDRDVSGYVRRAELAVAPGGDVTLVLYLARLTPFVSSYARAVVDPETADLLRSLGWTAPEPGDGS